MTYVADYERVLLEVLGDLGLPPPQITCVGPHPDTGRFVAQVATRVERKLPTIGYFEDVAETSTGARHQAAAAALHEIRIQEPIRIRGVDEDAAAEARYSAFEVMALQGRVGELVQERDQARAERDGMVGRIADSRRREGRLRQERDEARAALIAAQQQVARQQAEIDESVDWAAEAHQQVDQMQIQIVQLQQELAAAQTQITDGDQRLAAVWNYAFHMVSHYRAQCIQLDVLEHVYGDCILPQQPAAGPWIIPPCMGGGVGPDPFGQWAVPAGDLGAVQDPMLEEGMEDVVPLAMEVPPWHAVPAAEEEDGAGDPLGPPEEEDAVSGVSGIDVDDYLAHLDDDVELEDDAAYPSPPHP